ncbi:MAG: ABC transporter substrate-binding protein [Chloroflexota bacterium]|nr:ABC transporter substrate-binding protein [Chloroflexota bacterium]
MKNGKLTRRDFLRLSAMTAAGVTAAACARATPAVVEKEVVVTKEVEKEVPVEKVVKETVEVEKEVVKETVEVAPSKFNEAPALAELVEAGELPPVDERLPLNPFVVGGREEIGTYGGEVRQIDHDVVGSVSVYDWYSDRLLQYSDVDMRTLVPNMLERWEVSEDGTTFTLHMRKGMKWSDGEPLTTEDVDFWWNDWATLEGVGWVGAAFAGIQGEWAEIEIIDDYTFRVKYDYPFGIFPHVLTRHPGGYPPEGPFMPKHFLKDYHIDYAGEAALQRMMDDLGLEMWQQVINRFAGWGRNIWNFPEFAKDLPTLAPWIPVSYPAEGTVICERNPYYWKVDLVGNQLPYIDTLRRDYVASVEAMNIKAIGGELDWLGMHDVTIARYPLYKENEERGRYVVGDYLSCMTDRYTLYPRHTLPGDPVLEEIVNHPNFVRALSVAINREEINESLFYGMARMGQLAPMPNSKYYKEKYGTAWAQYDPALANRLLDEMGLDKRDSAGFRLRPDGKRLLYCIEHPGIRVGAAVHEFTEMVCTYWREIGIDATTKEIDESLYNERMLADEIHCGIWHADRCTDMLLPVQMQWYIPTGDPQQGGASAAWYFWYAAKDKEAEGIVEPPERIKQLYAWVDKMREVVDEDERVEWGQKIFDDLAENPLSIGTVLESPCPLLINKNMRNLPRPKVPIGWDTYGINTYHPAAFFFEGGQRA